MSYSRPRRAAMMSCWPITPPTSRPTRPGTRPASMRTRPGAACTAWSAGKPIAVAPTAATRTGFRIGGGPCDAVSIIWNTTPTSIFSNAAPRFFSILPWLCWNTAWLWPAAKVSSIFWTGTACPALTPRNAPMPAGFCSCSAWPWPAFRAAPGFSTTSRGLNPWMAWPRPGAPWICCRPRGGRMSRAGWCASCPKLSPTCAMTWTGRRCGSPWSRPGVRLWKNWARICVIFRRRAAGRRWPGRVCGLRLRIRSQVRGCAVFGRGLWRSWWSSCLNRLNSRRIPAIRPSSAFRSPRSMSVNCWPCPASWPARCRPCWRISPKGSDSPRSFWPCRFPAWSGTGFSKAMSCPGTYRPTWPDGSPPMRVCASFWNVWSKRTAPGWRWPCPSMPTPWSSWSRARAASDFPFTGGRSRIWSWPRLTVGCMWNCASCWTWPCRRPRKGYTQIKKGWIASSNTPRNDVLEWHYERSVASRACYAFRRCNTKMDPRLHGDDEQTGPSPEVIPAKAGIFII